VVAGTIRTLTVRSLRRAVEREPARSLAAGTMLGCEGEFEAADRLSAAEPSLEPAGATSLNQLTQTLAAMPRRRDFKTRRRPRDAAEDRQQQAEGGDRFRQPLPGPLRTVIDNCHNGSSNIRCATHTPTIPPTTAQATTLGRAFSHNVRLPSGRRRGPSPPAGPPPQIEDGPGQGSLVRPAGGILLCGPLPRRLARFDQHSR
jgi:hypothetical protein